MTDEAALLAAIIAEPGEDTPRLVYADKLDEIAGEVECGACKGNGLGLALYNDGMDYSCPTCSGTGRVSDGRAARAEFIRVQVELARMPEEKMAFDLLSIPELFQSLTKQVSWKGKPISDDQLERCVRFQSLRRREREILSPGPLWTQLPGGNWGWTTSASTLTAEAGNGQPVAVWSRGFASHLFCTWDSWRTHAAAILAAQPVERVRLTTWPEHAVDNGEFYPHRLYWFPSLPDKKYNAVDVKPPIEEGLLALIWNGITFELPAEGIREAIIAGAGDGDLRVVEGE